MRHDARLSSVVPQRTAFLPPAFIATLPPRVQASCEVGSTANTQPDCPAISATRRVTTPASPRTVGTGCATPGRVRISTAPRPSSFSVLMMAVSANSGTALPV